jgi:hypothetical protein
VRTDTGGRRHSTSLRWFDFRVNVHPGPRARRARPLSCRTPSAVHGQSGGHADATRSRNRIDRRALTVVRATGVAPTFNRFGALRPSARNCADSASQPFAAPAPRPPSEQAFVSAIRVCMLRDGSTNNRTPRRAAVSVQVEMGWILLEVSSSQVPCSCALKADKDCYLRTICWKNELPVPGLSRLWGKGTLKYLCDARAGYGTEVRVLGTKIASSWAPILDRHQCHLIT